MSARDDALEALIQAAWRELCDAACRESRAAAFSEMREQIQRLEREKGLRA